MMVHKAEKPPSLSWSEQAFETDMAGVPVGKLRVSGTPGRPEAAGLIDEWRREDVWLVSCRVNEADQETADVLENAGFRRIETLVTLSQPARPANATTLDIRMAGAEDIGACVSVAKASFILDRLHRDPEVPDGFADQVRAAWIANDINGRAAAPLIASIDGEIAGFNLCVLRDRTAAIDLIATAPKHRRKGVAAQLIDAAFRVFGSEIDEMRVGTQADNLASLRLYEQAGFSKESGQITLHWTNPEMTPEGDAA